MNYETKIEQAKQRKKVITATTMNNNKKTNLQKSKNIIARHGTCL